MRGSGLAAVAAMLAFVTTSAFAHPFTLDDYFRLEAVGQVAVAPDDRRLVFERQGTIGSPPAPKVDRAKRAPF